MGALAQLASGREAARSDFPTISLDQFGDMLRRQGILLTGSLQGRIEQVENSFPGFISGAYKSNSAIFALECIRFLLFSQVRLQFQQLRNGQPGDLFGTADLAMFEKPWTNATTGDLLARMLLYADFAGNAYAVRRMGRTGPVIRLPRPDWMTILVGSQDPNADFVDLWDIDAEIVGYQYHPGGIGVGKPVSLLPETVAHFAPIPDPIARVRGMSIWTPCLTEIEADTAATEHKASFFSNGATVSTTITVNNPLIKTPDDFRVWIDEFEAEHRGATEAYHALYLMNGIDVKPIGADFQQMDFSKTQGAGEVRLASAAGVPAAMVGFSEGLSGSSLNKGNIQELKKLMADKTMRPLWGNACGSLATLITEPGGSRLWYDDQHVPFLAEDAKEAADILFVKAQAIKQLWDGGGDTASVIDAIVSGDLGRLSHTGLFSVQLQAPGSAITASPTTPIPPSAQSARARQTFWSAGGSVRGAIIEGTCVRLDDGNGGINPWIAAYPSMFEPSEEVPIVRLVEPLQLPERIERLSGEVRCQNCDKLLAERATPPYRMTCRHCKTVTEAVDSVMRSDDMSRFLVETQRNQAELLVALAARSETPAINVSSPVTIAEGAIRIDLPRAERQDAPQVRFEEGAFHVEVHAPEPARMSIEQGAVQVNVQPSPVTIAEGAMQVRVEPSPVTIEEGAVQVRVEPSPVTIEQGAMQVEVHAPEPAQVTIEKGAVHVENHPGNVTIEEGAISAPDVIVNVPPPPPVTIEEGAVRVDVHPAAAPSVTLAKGAVSAPEVHVTVEKDVPLRTVFDRDPQTGRLSGSHEEPV